MHQFLTGAIKNLCQSLHELIAAERPRGVFSRQLILGDTLDTDRVKASYDGGVLTLRIPIAEKAKPRRIESNEQSLREINA